MYFSDYEQSLAHGLTHIDGSRRRLDEDAINLLNSNQGSRSGCLTVLCSNTSALALNQFFRESDIRGFKQWSYISGKNRIMLQHENNNPISIELILWPLISDNDNLIQWYCQNRVFYETPDGKEEKYNIDTREFYRLQVWRALNGAWEELNSDCERALREPEKFSAKLKSRLATFRFLNALARGNKFEMEAVLLEKCAPRFRSKSYQYESGLTNNFIVSYATLFAKIAWRHGYELDLDTPWIPKEWLPVRPNPSYEDPWPFMKNFDIWQPFNEPLTQYSPRRPSV